MASLQRNDLLGQQTLQRNADPELKGTSFDYLSSQWKLNPKQRLTALISDLCAFAMVRRQKPARESAPICRLALTLGSSHTQASPPRSGLRVLDPREEEANLQQPSQGACPETTDGPTPLTGPGPAATLSVHLLESTLYWLQGKRMSWFCD